MEPVDPADPPTLEELRTFVREQLADYKAPDRLEVVAELPMTSMLKIDKRVLQAQLAQERLSQLVGGGVDRVEGAEVRDHLLAEDPDRLQHLVLRERAHLDEAHHVVDAGGAQPFDVGDGGVGVTERVVGVVQR